MAGKGEIPRCPSCGSSAVHWRRRHLVDQVRTLLLCCTDYLLGHAHDRPRRETNRDIYEIGIGIRTANLFWRCPDCRRNGTIFDPEVVDKASERSERTRER